MSHKFRPFSAPVVSKPTLLFQELEAVGYGPGSTSEAVKNSFVLYALTSQSVFTTDPYTFIAQGAIQVQ